MEQVNLDDFDREVNCTFKDETYSVRDNGAVFRHSRKGARKRPLDEKWMFGRADEKRGYMYISSIMVHQIVATAYHGPRPSKEHVVDHIDTNKRNNRPENLHWVTRLENILLNPITRYRVEIAYGSIENFFADPSKPLHGHLDPDFKFMRTVTKKQAAAYYRNLLDMAKSGRMPSGRGLGEWIYRISDKQHVEKQEPDMIESLTPGAIQKNWKTPSEFPLCPSDTGATALVKYRERLKEGEVFARDKYGESKVVSAEFSERRVELIVLCNKPGVKDWNLARISVDGQLFIHENLGSFFRLDGATKHYTLERGLEWEGGDTFDDYVR